MEQTVIGAKPEVTPVVEKAKEPDLITRVSQVKDAPKEVKPTAEPEFDYKEIEQIQDPKAREYAEKAYKSFQRGYGTKFQELAETRKSLETERQKYQEATNWTPDKVQQLMNDQKFVQSANQVLQSQAPQDWKGSQNEWSALNDKEKQEFNMMKQEINSLRLQTTLEQQRRQDETLKTKFANYNPQAVDIITNDLLQGKVNATREDLWKVYDYENAVKRAYELGKQDRKLDDVEKVNASSIDGVQMNSPNRAEAPKKDESSQGAFKRIMLENIAKFKGRNQ